jgi:hypothetical protein
MTVSFRCTQCKWKKACARFGSHAHPAAVEKNNNQPMQQHVTLPSQSSLLMTAQQMRPQFDASSPAIKAIKF